MSNARRILVVGCALFALFSVLIVQFFRMQVVQESKWQRYAKAQHELVVKEPFKRGLFYSNVSVAPEKNLKEQALVVDIPVYHLFADPFQLPQKKHAEIKEKLSELLNLSTEEQDRLVVSLGYEKSRSRKIKMWLSQEEKNKLSQWWFQYCRKNKIAYNALYFTSDYKRSYPFDSLLGQVLHTIREGKEEITQQGIPTGGLEYYFNDLLSGTPGKKKLLRSPKNPLELGRMLKEPKHGADVYLSINHHLQAIVEEELQKGVQNYGAKAAWAIMMDPYTGEIYAFGQYPFFNPNCYKDYYNDADKIQAARLRGLCDTFEVGSIIKPVSMAICLLANEECKRQNKPPLFNPEDKVACLSGKFPGRTRDLVDPRPHRYMNMYHALQKSANIYLARMVERVIDTLGPEWYREQMANTFGFSSKTKVEYPMEASGVVPSPGQLHDNGTLQWSTPTPFSLAIGYNFMVNSLHMVRAFATFANGGYLVQPTFVRKIVQTNPEGKEEVLLDHTTEKWRNSFPKVLSSEIANTMHDALKYCVRKGGNSNLADVYGYTVAGKSGTARKLIKGQYSSQNHFVSFIGFAPTTQPRFILLVSMDEPDVQFKPGKGYTYYGGKCAGPVFREITRRSLQYLGVKPDNPNHYPPGDPRSKPLETHWYKETKALQELYDKWNLKK